MLEDPRIETTFFISLTSWLETLRPLGEGGRGGLLTAGPQWSIPDLEVRSYIRRCARSKYLITVGASTSFGLST